MLAANVCASAFLEEHKQSCLYRIHEGPTPEKLEGLRDFLKEFGLGLTGGDSPTAKDYGKLLDMAQRAFALKLGEPAFKPRRHSFQRRPAQQAVMRFDVRVNRQRVHAMRPQIGRQRGQREIRRGRVRGRRINQGNVQHISLA